MTDTLKFVGLPFEPDTQQIIYIESSYDEATNNLIRENYDLIDAFFRLRNLQFCYLPLLTKSLGEERRKYNLPHNNDSDATDISSSSLNRYISDKQLAATIGPSLIKYIQRDRYDRSYSFRVEPITSQDLSSAENISSMLYRLLGPGHGGGEKYSLRSEESYGSISFSEPDSFQACRPSFIKRLRDYKERSSSDTELAYCKKPTIEKPKHVPAEELDPESMLLLREIEERVNKLKLRGVEVMISGINDAPKLSRLVVTRDFRIILPDYGNIEIEMTPLVKAVYLLFLRHEEGIEFKNLIDYRDELMDIYIAIRNYSITCSMGRSIEDITNPFKNSINEKRARIREAFYTRFNPSLAKNYIIIGERGETKRIPLDRHLVEWQK